jgi:TPR repeat protein
MDTSARFGKRASMRFRAPPLHLLVAGLGLSFMYANGQGVPQDYAAAMSWYRRAA